MPCKRSGWYGERRRHAEAARTKRRKYTVIWGQSVYYKEQDKYTKRKMFTSKKEALAFLRKKNRTADFTDLKVE